MYIVVGQAGDKLQKMLMYLMGIRELERKTEPDKSDGKTDHR